MPPALNRALALLTLLALLSVTCLAAVSTRFGWNMLLELAAHFQLQYFRLALALMALLLLTRQRIPILIGLFCVAWLSMHVLPWYVPPLRADKSALTQPPAADPNLKLLWANLWAENRQFAELISLVQQEQPDIVLLSEVNPAWQPALSSLRDRFPYTYALDGRGTSGIAVLSQLPFRAPQIQQTGSNPRPVIGLDLAIANRPFSLIVTHPLPPVRSQWFHWRNRQLADAAEMIAQRPQPVVFVGDLNTTMWSPYYRRLITHTNLQNTRRGFGTLPSWTPGYTHLPDRLQALLSIPIDHCLVSPTVGVKDTRIGAAIGSDHRPLIVDLSIPNT